MGLGVFPIPLREFLMAGGAEFGKMTAAGSAAESGFSGKGAADRRKK